MSIQDDLLSIANRANRELDAVNDFYEHSVLVWRSFALFVTNGHDFTSTSKATGTVVNAVGLSQLTHTYTRKYLASFVFRQYVSCFESFFFEFFQRVLQQNPWQYAKTQLDFEAVLKASDRDEIIAGVLMRKLNELKYESVRGWFEALNKIAKLDCPTEAEVDAFAEVKATRDLLEHNAGIANETYIRKTGKLARYVVGEVVEIDDDYHLQSWRLLKKLTTDLTTSAMNKFA